MSINKRIKTLRKELKLNQQTFGEKIGVTESAVCNFENGRRNPSEQTVRSICREFNVNKSWLLEGTGSMFVETDELEILIAKMLAGQNETAVQLFKAFAELDESDWQVIQKIIDNLKNT